MEFSRAPGQNATWKVEDRVVRYEDDHVCVASEKLRTPAHPAGKKWTTVHRKQAVVVAAMTKDERLILIHQERIPVRAAIWEMPAGQVDEENPDRKQIEATALRELEEETGYTLLPGGEMISLGNVSSSPGFTDEEEHLFARSSGRPLAREDEGRRINH